MCIATLFGIIGMLALTGDAQGARSTILYECGANICSIDPSGGKPKRVTANGTSELPYSSPSISHDGSRLTVARGGQALFGPLGGALRNFGRFADRVAAVVIAPDGSQPAVITARSTRVPRSRCYWTIGGLYCDYLAFDVVDQYTTHYPRGVSRQSSSNIGFTARGGMLQATLEELGDGQHRFTVTETARPAAADAPARVVLTSPTCDFASSCPADFTTFMAPTGSPDGRHIAAVVDLAEGSDPEDPAGQTLNLYDARTGALVRALATGATNPAFSPDGRFVAYEAAGANPTIRVVPVSGGAPRELVAGARPTWGGAPGRLAPVSLMRLRGTFAVRARCAAGTCAGRLTIRQGRRVVGQRDYRIMAGRAANVRVSPTRPGRRLIQSSGSPRLTVSLTSLADRRTVSRRLPLR